MICFMTKLFLTLINKTIKFLNQRIKGVTYLKKIILYRKINDEFMLSFEKWY